MQSDDLLEKSWLIRKDPHAGKDWRQEERGWQMTMVGWHHQLNGHEFEQAPGDGEGQGNPGCYSQWGRKESETAEWLNNNKQKLWWFYLLDNISIQNIIIIFFFVLQFYFIFKLYIIVLVLPNIKMNLHHNLNGNMYMYVECNFFYLVLVMKYQLPIKNSFFSIFIEVFLIYIIWATRFTILRGYIPLIVIIKSWLYVLCCTFYCYNLVYT